MTAAALLHGWTGILLGFGTVQAPMLVAMVRSRAPIARYLLAPALAVPLTLVAAGATAFGSALMPAMGVETQALLQLFLGSAISAVTGYAGGRVLATRDVPGAVHERGSVVIESDTPSTDRSRSPGRGSEVTLAGIPVPYADETKHFKLIGTTGTGKSTAITEILTGALARGDRAVIADPDGGYLRKFYAAARGDVILNPFEPLSAKWDLFAEVMTAHDVEQLARSLIPDETAADRSWRGYARTFFSAVTRQAREAGIDDIAELFRLLVVAEPGELRTLLRGTPAQPFLDQHNMRMFDSIRSVTASAVGALEYVASQNAPALSIRQWVKEGHSGVLFIPYRAGQIAALRSIVSAWMRIAIFETLSGDATDAAKSMPDERRIWFVVDELDALGEIDGLKDALARTRKFGGRCVLGFQSVAQVSSTYGHGDAHTIVENCANTLILRCSASEGGGTARFASQLIGEREVRRTMTSTSKRFDEFFGATTRSEHLSVEPALLPSQIERLPDLSGYLKLASAADWRHVTLKPPAADETAARPIEAARTAAASALHDKQRQRGGRDRE